GQVSRGGARACRGSAEEPAAQRALDRAHAPLLHGPAEPRGDVHGRARKAVSFGGLPGSGARLCREAQAQGIQGKVTMRKSSDRILTSHAGSLPRPDDLIEANASREAGKVDEAAFQNKLTQAVADVVRRQVEAGIAVPGDGEYGKSMGHKINYRAWWSY